MTKRLGSERGATLGIWESVTDRAWEAAVNQRLRRCGYISIVVAMTLTAALGSAPANAASPPNYWSAGPAMSVPRQSAAVTVDGGRLYAIGGHNASSGYLSSAEVYDPASGTWMAIAPMQVSRSLSATATGGDGRVYVIGGVNGSHLDSVEAYSPVTNSWTWTAPLPAPNDGMSAATGADGRIYVMGGIGLVNTTAVSSVSAYDSRKDRWTQVASMSTPRYGSAASAGLDGRVYVLGGSTSGDYGHGIASAEVYSPVTNTWSRLPPMSTRRSHLAAATGSDGRIFAIGGFDQGGANLSSVEAFDPRTGAWEPASSLPAPRGDAGAAWVQSMVRVVGGTDGSSALATMDAYTALRTRLSLGVPNNATARRAIGVTVTVRDGYGNRDAGYIGTVHFTSSDSAAALPADYAFTGADAGVHTFAVTLFTPRSQTVTATDTVTSLITDTSATITVSPGAETHLVVSAPISATGDSPITLTVTAADSSNNAVIGYTGRVQFSSTDGAASLPIPYIFTSADAGVHTFSATLHTSGSQTVTATDTASITGTSGPITVNAAPAFLPRGVGAPAVAVAPDGTQMIFWQGSGGHLIEAWWHGVWNGPVDWTTANRWAPSLSSAPSVAIATSGTQMIFWQGAGGHLIEAWWDGTWNGPVDWTAAYRWAPSLTSAPSVTIAPNGTQTVFWQAVGGHLAEAWWNGVWNGPVDWTAANRWAPSLNSAPSVAIAPNNVQIVFWQGPGGHLMEAWWNGSWDGPVDWTAAMNWAASLISAPSVAIAPNNTEMVFWRGGGGHLIEAWWNGTWDGPVDWTAANNWAPSLTSAPSVAIAPNNTQMVFWQGAGSTLWEAWYANGWNGPVNWSPASSAQQAFSFDIQPVLQNLPLDCEAAALEEATRAKGRDVSQNTFFNSLAKQPGSATWSGRNIARWGNPYVGFVGDVYGSESAGTGYGVYNGPIASAAISEGFNAVNLESGNVEQIQSLVLQGDPVIIWTSNTFVPVAMRTWTAWDGNAVPYALTEHTVTVVGVDELAGTITVNDVGDGRMKTFTTGQFAAFWSSFGNMAVALE